MLARQLKVVGMDPSLRNWGLACGTYDCGTGKLTLGKQGLLLIQAELPTGKQTRQNSLDLESAYQLFQGATTVLAEAQAVFVEVPEGSQNARAMAGYGIVVGVLGAIRAAGMPFFEVTPTEVKLASVGNKTATKKQMIAWAMQSHPEANWPTYKQNGEILVSEAKAEHMADATAAIYAGLQCRAFQQMLPLLAA